MQFEIWKFVRASTHSQIYTSFGFDDLIPAENHLTGNEMDLICGTCVRESGKRLANENDTIENFVASPLDGFRRVELINSFLHNIFTLTIQTAVTSVQLIVIWACSNPNFHKPHAPNGMICLARKSTRTFVSTNGRKNDERDENEANPITPRWSMQNGPDENNRR